MQSTGDKTVYRFPSALHIAVTMIMIHTEAVYQAESSVIPLRQTSVPKKALYRVLTLLQRKHGILLDLPYGQQPVAGCHHMCRILIHRPESLFYMSAEAVIEAGESVHHILLRIDLCLPDKAFDQGL
jgi:hypothetical protein